MKRKIYKLLSNTKQGLLAFALAVFSGTAYSQATYTFNYTGSVQTLTLPAGVWGIECWGGNGGDVTAGPGGGGKGGYSQGALNVITSGTVLNIFVGGKGGSASGTGSPAGNGGWNGGGGGGATGKSGGGGGGGTDVRLTGIAATDRIIVAGGGGGAAYYTLLAAGGNGGAVNGQNGDIVSSSNVTTVGGGGAGATGGSPGLSPNAFLTTNGTATGGGGGGNSPGIGFGQPGVGGGAGGAAGSGGSGLTGGSGGGGGGYAGGAGGTQTVNVGAAGGGGSGYIGGVSNAITTMTGQPGYLPNPDPIGNGRVVITSLCNITLINASTTGPGPICAGNSATIATNAISNYAWSNGSTNASIVVTPSVTTSYTLTATSPSNCTASSVITITVQSGNPIVTALTSNTAVCAGQPVVLSGAGANTYTWTGGVTNAVSFSPTATGGYSVIGANACGTGTASVNVTVNPSPVVLGGVTSPTICSGTAVTFTSAGNATTYSWSNGVINNSPYIPGATNNYVLTGTANGCSSITVVGVTVFITPTITPIATPSAICVGQTSTLSAQGATGYTWTPGSNLSAAVVTVSPPAPTTYSLYRTNGLCASATTLFVVVNPIPLLSASGSPSQICMGTGVVLNITGAITYTWLPGNFTAANFTLYPNFSTTYTVTGSSGSCTASQTVPVIVNPTPTLTINTPTSTICQGQSVTLTAGGALSYTWQTAGGGNNASQPVSPSTTTIYVVSGTNSYGCTSSQNQLILVNPTPTIVINSSAPYACSGSTVVLSVNNSSSNITYLWNSGPVGPSISVNPITTTNYFVTGTDNNTGCTSTGTTALAVYISTFAVTAPTAICIGSVATFSAAGAAATYSWSVNGGTAAPSVTVSPAINSTYYVTGTTGSCTTTQTLPLVVNPLPNVTASAAKGQICRFEIATITGNGASTYSWNTGANSQVLTFTLSLTTTYTLTGTDTKGCSKTTTVTQFVATCIGIENNSPDNLGLNIYPNPNNGNFVISSDVSVTLYLVNALGQEINTFNLNEGDKQVITVSNLPSGIYFINGQSTGVKINKKVIIER